MKNTNERDSLFSRGWVVAASLISLIIGGLVVLLLLPKGATETAQVPSPSPSLAQSADTSTPEPLGSAAPSAKATKPAKSGECKTPKAKDKGIPTKLEDVELERHPAGMLVVTSDDLGPTERTSDAWRCHARSPKGAAIASLILVTNFAAGDEGSGIDSPERDELFKTLSVDAGTEFGTPEAFRVVTAGKDETLVEWELTRDGSSVILRVPLVWDEERGDWALDTTQPDELRSWLVKDTSETDEFVKLG